MKKLTIYEINDGLDGVILAKSLKQAMKILAPYYKYPVKNFINSIKNCEKNYRSESDWILTNINKVPKKKEYKKPRMLGWYE